MKDLIGPIVRAILQVVSGVLVTKGLLSHAEAGPVTEAVVGAVLAVSSVVWSTIEKKKIRNGQPPAVPPVVSLCLLLIPILAFAPIGCATKKSPERIAITATGSVVKTADAAIASWADYVVLRKEQIKKLKLTDVGAAMEVSNELLRYEGRVSKAYYEYQEAAKAAIAIGATSSSPAAVSEKLAAASANLITLIASLTASR